MHRLIGPVLFLLLAVGSASVAAQSTNAPLPKEAYERAEAVLPQHIDELIFEMSVRPQWFKNASRFWFEQSKPDGHRFVSVDPDSRTMEPLFDHAKLRTQLSSATNRTIDPTTMRLSSPALSADEKSFEFSFAGKRWRYQFDGSGLSEHNEAADNSVLSPDGRRRVFFRSGNLFVANLETGAEVQLSDNSAPGVTYARPIVSVKRMIAEGTEQPVLPPDVTWSPDSRKIATYRIDYGESRRLALVQSTPPGGAPPRTFNYYYTLAGDEQIPVSTGIIYDAESGQAVPIKLPPEPVLQSSAQTYRWSPDSQAVYRRFADRGYKAARLVRIDATTGESRSLLEEASKTYITWFGQFWTYDPDSDKHYLTSDREGITQLYQIDGRSGAQRRLTDGKWRVHRIEGVAQNGRLVFVTGTGRKGNPDPYIRSLYVLDPKTGGVRDLTPEQLDHDVSISPDGRYFVDNMSLINRPTVSLLRSAHDGHSIMELGRADLTRFSSAGYLLPEPFEALAADGKTKIYGSIFRPAGFDPTRKYPVIESIYAGPPNLQTPKSFEAAMMYRTPQSLAQLGAIGVTVDGRGTTGRTRAFQEVAYQNLREVGIDDHVAAIKSLARRFPWVDDTQVGIYGISYGGFDVVRAMTLRPDFYKVGASEAGSHISNFDKASYQEQWMGFPLGPQYERNSNATWVGNLQGKLLIVHGELDENVPPPSSMRLVDALIRANKDFEFLMLPNVDHLVDNSSYYIRRRMDFFTRWLLNREPPKDYRMRSDFSVQFQRHGWLN